MHRMRWLIGITLVITAALTLSAWHPAQAATSPVTVTLNAENDSGEIGTATLTDLGNGRTTIEVTIEGEPEGAVQPMHVHAGQCGPTLGSVTYPLTSLENGKSTTTIEATLDSLTTGGFAINGHKSAEETTVYVFCGNIPSEAMMMAEATATHEAMMMAEATATHEAMMMAEATATHESMMMAEATATHEAMMMAEATATHEAMMMAEATATHEAMMMAEATATHEAMMMAEATATHEAMMAQGSPTPEGIAIGTATPAPQVMPTTGGTPGSNWLLPVVVLAGLLLGVGFTIRRSNQRH